MSTQVYSRKSTPQKAEEYGKGISFGDIEDIEELEDQEQCITIMRMEYAGFEDFEIPVDMISREEMNQLEFIGLM